MANELRANFNGSATIYAILRKRSNLYVWNGSAFEAWDNANIATYDIPLTSGGGDMYAADFPAAITTAGYYVVNYYKQAGGSPATTDLILDSETIYWTSEAVSSGGGGGGGSTATMTLTEARTIVRLYARNAGDSSVYTDATIDRAILSAGNDFVNRTRCVWETASTTLSASDATITSIGSTATGFRPDRIKRVYIPEYGTLAVVDQGAIEDAKYAGGVETEGLPTLIAFTGDQAVEVYPVPDDDYVLKTFWYPPFSIFSPGADGATTLNIPADIIRGVLEWGATYELQWHMPEHQAIISQAKTRYEEHVQRYSGFANLGPKVVQLQTADSIPYQRTERETYQ